MREEHWAMGKALRFVQQRRPTIQPNVGFMEQLRALEVRLDLHEAEAHTPDSGVDDGVDTDGPEEADQASNAADDDSSAVGIVDVQVEVTDLFGAKETRLRCERFRSRCQRLRNAAGLLGIAAPLRKRERRNYK